MAMNLSYFKLEYSGKPDEDPEAQILRTIDWMDTHNFTPNQRIQRFPLTLTGEARLWYQSIHPFQGNLEDLQERLSTQFSKIGNTRKQLPRTWKIFYLMKMQKQLMPMCRE